MLTKATRLSLGPWGGALLAAMLAVLGRGPAPLAAAEFRRGDADASGRLDLTDAVRVLLHLFGGEGDLPCLDAADADDGGAVSITDPIFLLNHLFRGGGPLPEPASACGPDPTADGLDCAIFPPCLQAPSEFERIGMRFGNLETLAGTGASDAGAEWDAAFEGEKATDAELSRPHNALGDDAGNIYIADKEAHGIRKVTPDGRIFTVAGTSLQGDGPDEPGPGTSRALSNPNGLWVRGDGTVYILDLDNGKVRRLAPDGIMTTLFKVPDLVLGRGLWVADDERLAYVASGSEVIRWRATEGTDPYVSGFGGIANLAVDRQGRLYVTDQSRHQVFRIDLDRTSFAIAGNGGTSGGGDGELALDTGLNEVRGIWLVEGAGYFLCTHRGSQVWYVDSAGIIHLFLDGDRDESTHSGDGLPWSTPGRKVSEVRSVTLDRQGNLLVTENDLGYIRMVRRKPGS